MVNGNEIDMALGNTMSIAGFVDGKDRDITPLPFEQALQLQSVLKEFDNENFTFIENEREFAYLIIALKLAFGIDQEDTQQISELLANVSEEFYPQLIQDIKQVNYIKDSENSSGSNDESTTSWARIVIAFLGCGLSIDVIKKLTLFQLVELQNYLNDKDMFLYKVNTVVMAENTSEYLTNSDFPMISKKSFNLNETEETSQRMVTMQELLKFSTKGGN